MDTIVQRIAKLLALAANNPDPHEAEAAAALANRLMLQHSISLETVRAAKGGKDAFTHQTHTTGKYASWEVTLLCIIARANLCEVVKIGRDQFTVLGLKDNVSVTLEMQRWLRDEVHRLAREKFLMRDEASDFGAMDPHRFHTSFKHGANRALQFRLERVQQEVERETKDAGSAIVLITDKVKKYTSEIYPSTRPTKSSAGRNANHSAYAAGQEAGSKVALKPTKMIGE